MDDQLHAHQPLSMEGTSCSQQDPSVLSQERETQVGAVPVARAMIAALAASWCCILPASRPCRCRGCILWSTISLFLVPTTLRQAAMLCCMWGHYSGQPCHVLLRGSFPWPHSPSLRKPHKHCTEMHVLVHLRVSPSLSALKPSWTWQASPGVARKGGSNKEQKGGGGCLHLWANFRSACSNEESKAVSLPPMQNYPGISGASKMPKSSICTVLTWHQSLVLSFVCCICMLLVLNPRLNTYEALLCNSLQWYWEWSCTLRFSRK